MLLISIKKVLAKVWLLNNAYIFNFEIYGNLSWQDHYFEGEIILTDSTSQTNNNKTSSSRATYWAVSYVVLGTLLAQLSL